VIIARKIGVEGVGRWADLKAEIEFLAVFFAFGFPSSIT
jgi:hypothetical protein